MSLHTRGGSQVQIACTLTPHQNYAALCRSLSSAPTATHQEVLNFPCDLYHGLSFASYPPSMCCQPLFQLLPLGAPFCFGDQSDSHRAKPHDSQGEAIVQGSRWMDDLSTKLCGPTLLHLEQQSPTFLATGTCLMEDKFFHGLGGGGNNSFWMFQVHYMLH